MTTNVVGKFGIASENGCRYLVVDLDGGEVGKYLVLRMAEVCAVLDGDRRSAPVYVHDVEEYSAIAACIRNTHPPTDWGLVDDVVDVGYENPPDVEGNIGNSDICIPASEIRRVEMLQAQSQGQCLMEGCVFEHPDITYANNPE